MAQHAKRNWSAQQRDRRRLVGSSAGMGLDITSQRRSLIFCIFSGFDESSDERKPCMRTQHPNYDFVSYDLNTCASAFSVNSDSSGETGRYQNKTLRLQQVLFRSCGLNLCGIWSALASARTSSLSLERSGRQAAIEFEGLSRVAFMDGNRH